MSPHETLLTGSVKSCVASDASTSAEAALSRPEDEGAALSACGRAASWPACHIQLLQGPLTAVGSEPETPRNFASLPMVVAAPTASLKRTNSASGTAGALSCGAAYRSMRRLRRLTLDATHCALHFQS